MKAEESKKEAEKQKKLYAKWPKTMRECDAHRNVKRKAGGDWGAPAEWLLELTMEFCRSVWG